MKHEELKELLPLYIDGGLDRDEVEMVEAHLAECEDCRELLSLYQGNYNFLTSVEDVEVDEDFLQSLMARVREEDVKGVASDQMAQPNGESRLTRGSYSWWKRLKEIFNFRLRIPAGALGVGFAVILLIFVMRPFENVQYQKSIPEEDINYYNIQSELNEQVKMGRSLNTPQMDQMNLRQKSASNQGVALVDETIERKIIQIADLRIEVKDIQSADQAIVTLIEGLDGFISNSRRWESGDQRQFSSFTLRIPADRFTQALTQVEGLGKVKDRSSYGQDVTEEYIDVESRLKNLTLQEERYRELLERATAVEDILSIERELERVRSTLESLQGRLNYLDNQVGLSTLNVELMEPEPIASSNVGIVNALRQALRKMVDTFYDIIVRIGVIIPYLIIGLVLYGLYRIIRRR